MTTEDDVWTLLRRLDDRQWWLQGGPTYRGGGDPDEWEQLTLEFATLYASLGWSVLPIHGIDDDLRCTCGRKSCAHAGKHPATTHGIEDASTDPDQVREWFSSGAPRNVAIAVTEAAGILVIDGDERTNQMWWEELAADEHGDEGYCDEAIYVVSSRLRSITPGPGSHHYFSRPPGVPLRTRPGGLHRGVDLIASSYAIEAPSRHRNGDRYRWLFLNPPEAAPPWLLDRIVALGSPPRTAGARTSRPAPAATSTAGGATTAWGRAVLRREADGVMGVAQGQRNTTLNTAAFRCGQAVGGGELDIDEARLHLERAAQRTTPPLQAAEFKPLIARALSDGAQSPRTAPRQAQLIPVLDRVAASAFEHLPPVEFRVLMAHLRAALRPGLLQYDVDVRTVAQWAGVSESTAARATKTLIEDGLLADASPSGTPKGHGRRYDLQPAIAWAQLSVQHPHTYLPPSMASVCADSTLEVGHPAWRRNALGESGRRLSARLRVAPASATELQAAVGFKARAVRDKLERMQELGLARRGGDGRWEWVPETNLDEVADKQGWTDATDRQRDRHAHDRRKRQRQQRDEQSYERWDPGEEAARLRGEPDSDVPRET